MVKAYRSPMEHSQVRTTGEVVQFPKQHTRLRKKPYWRLVDLLGKEPNGHVRPTYGKLGRVIMAPGQVWVEIHNQQLWVITELTKNPKREGNFYPHDVVLVEYGGGKKRVLAETGVRGSMMVWEVYLPWSKETTEQFLRASQHDPSSPFRGQPKAALDFFGLDIEGNRIDD
mgnify:CR=1 FL=1